MPTIRKNEGESFTCALCAKEHPAWVEVCPEKGERLRAVHRMGGKVIDDKYVVRRFVAEGGMGAVYEGVNRDIGRRVAIKFLHRSISRNPQHITQFENEARITASLGHRNIVDVLDMGVTGDDMYYLVMEFLQGSELSKLLHETVRLPYFWAVDIAIQVLEALGQVHALGVVHRDLKPENVYLVQQRDGTMTVKILDFGVSCLGHRGSPDMTSSSGTVIGTPLYMSPEQAMGLTKIDHRSDLYSVGVLLYEMLSGAYPFTADTPQQLLSMIVYAQPVPLGKHAVSVPPGLEAVVMWSIAKEPDERFADADEFIDALQPFREPEPSGKVSVVPVDDEPVAREAQPTVAASSQQVSSIPPPAEETVFTVEFQGIPENATIHVDGVLRKQRPIIVAGAGEHRFRVSARGHETWQRTLEIRSDVMLFIEMRERSR